MGMDRNTVIGFILIGALMIGMFAINSKGKLAMEGEQKRIADSIAALKPKVDLSVAKMPSVANDTNTVKNDQGIFGNSIEAAKTTSVENELFKITFSNKGAQPVAVELKKYNKFNGDKVALLKSSFNKISYPVNIGDNKTARSEELIFSTEPVTVDADKSQTIRFKLSDSTGKQIVHAFTIHPNEYMIDFNIAINGADRLFTQNKMSLLWQAEAPQIEKDHKYERTQSHICFKQGNDFDFEYLSSGDDKEFKKDLKWLSVKQQFFTAILASKNGFKNAKTEWTVPTDSSTYITRVTTTASVDLGQNNVANVPLQMYYGPSDYNILKKYENDYEQIVPYGTGIFSFVKYINRHILLPVFEFLQKYVLSMGLVVLLLTLFIRLLTSPILYKSYLSGAKMKVLKPEVDALRARFTDAKTGQVDQQAFSMEQMKLWKTAGVSPLGGCLPALLQIPIFMSLYYFFQSNIDLRGKNFLWSQDLSAYDSIAHLPFSIPFYGDHVSLFTLTAVITSLIISIYSMNQMQDNSNPLMKYMPYIFPVLLLGVFNNLPSALTWYYTVSNTITLILQIVIQKYIIDHDKILVQINENMKKPVKKSKLQERMEAMQETQKRLKEQKNKSGR